MRKSKSIIQLQITSSSTIDLRGRQSVRTTFKLSEKCIRALSILSGQLGIKQKSLFDQLVDDIQALTTIANEFSPDDAPRQRLAKTFVISRRTLDSLEYVSTRFDMPRDLLVEFSIERIFPLIEQEKTKHGTRKKLVNELAGQFRSGISLLEKAEELLGDEDPLVLEMRSMLRSYEPGFKRINDYLDRGRRLEDF